MVIQPLGNRQEFYDNFIDSCIKNNGGMQCKDTELDRIENLMDQPKGMENYTKVGFKKIKAPPELYKIVKKFWDDNKHKQTEEQWGTGNTYTNNWESKSFMVSVEDTSLRGSGNGIKESIWNAARDLISEWTGQELTQCSLYGVRVYTEGAILAPHVDRLPLVSSAILHVDSDVDEPWPLEVYSHDGRAYNVTSEPGDMILYESHSIIHGRPFRLKGRFVANLFIHFEPTGHSARHNALFEGIDLDQNVNAKYREAVLKGHGGHENELPPYVVVGSEQGRRWKKMNPGGYKQVAPQFTTGSTDAHRLAREGTIDDLLKQITAKKSLVNTKDENGWTPLHEGIASGHVDVVKLLIDHGADYNAHTHKEEGGTALWWAKQLLEEKHPIIEFLESLDALEAGPEL
jgi:prolyl 4-hydroxylase